MQADKHQGQKIWVGWQEWCALSKFGIGAIKAKMDTGAKTSAIHAFDIKPFKHHGTLHVSFALCPLQANQHVVRVCSAEVVDQRWIMSSNGHKENRYVIQTPISLADKTWNIELTLSDRDPLKFRLLLGRTALAERLVIDPSKKLCLGKLTTEQLQMFYKW
jgi:ribosomal protein S6--L-glutamate ligase